MGATLPEEFACYPFVWQKSLFVLGDFGAFAWVTVVAEIS